MKITAVWVLFSVALCCAPTAWADSFGSGASSFDIDFVTIGNPGNPADTTGKPNPAGKVEYTYRMGKFEISEQMIEKANELGGLGITKLNLGPDKPAMSISWFEAAHFVNWLNTSTGHMSAYKLDFDMGNQGIHFQLWEPSDPGYDSNNLYRNAQAKYFLPSVDEWYKAAYFDSDAGVYYDYPTGSDNPPTPVSSGTSPNTAVYAQTAPADITLAGGLSPYGTMAQDGNAWEWQETELDGVNDNLGDTRRGLRGSTYGHPRASSANIMGFSAPSLETDRAGSPGFRVASLIPEPSTLLLVSMASVGLLLRRKR